MFDSNHIYTIEKNECDRSPHFWICGGIKISQIFPKTCRHESNGTNEGKELHPHGNKPQIITFEGSGNMNIGTSRTIAKRCGNKYTIRQGCANNNRCKKKVSQRDRRSCNRTGFTRNPEYTRTHQNSNYGGISRK